jgi:proteasome accessory factor A
MAELSTYLKLGTAAILLEMLEASVEFPNLDLEDPVRAIKEVSRDLDMKGTLKLADGRVTSAIGIQRTLLKTAMDFYACHELTQITKDVLVRWEEVLDKLERDPMLLVRELDWVAKRQMIRSYMERRGCGWNDPRVLLLDLQYHDVRPEKGLYYTLERSNLIDRLLLDSEIAEAVHTAPANTRAYFRGSCLKKFPREVYAASWTSVLFDVGNTTIKKIPLMEPLRGTESLTRELLEGSDSAESLLAKLTA